MAKQKPTYYLEKDIMEAQTASYKPRILIADDQADVLKALRLLLKPKGYEIESASSVAEIIESIRAQSFACFVPASNGTVRVS